MVMTKRDRIRVKLKSGDTHIRILLSHMMHSGHGKTLDGEPIPEEFIQDIRCWRNNEEVLSIKCGSATARNPYFSFQLKGGEIGDKIAVRWVDNLGEKGGVETEVI